MPIYEVEDSRGHVIQIEGDREPNAGELSAIFMSEFPTQTMTAVAPPPGGQVLGKQLEAPTALTAGQVPSMTEQAVQAVEQQSAKNLAEFEQGGPIRIGEQPITIPRVGAEGSVLRGASEVVSGLAEFPLNRPEEALAMLWPPTAAAVAARYAPEIITHFLKRLGDAALGDDQALGEVAALSATIGLPIGARQLAKAREMRLDKLSFQWAAESLRQRDLIPETAKALDESTKPGGPSATPEIPKQESVRPQPESGVESGKATATSPGDSLLRQAEVAQEVVQNKPAQVVSEQAPRSEVPAEPMASAAVEPGVAAPGTAPAISEPTPTVSKTQTTAGTEVARQAEASASTTPAGEVEPAGAISLHGMPLTPSGGSMPGPVKGLHGISADLAKGLGVPIRYGRLTTSKFAGYFKPIQDLIGSKKAVDMPVVSHEVGHKLDSRLKFSGDPSLVSELNVLGDPTTHGSMSSWTKKRSTAYKMGEGVAEFVRHWLDDPTHAKTVAPKLYSAFEKAMDANPDWGDVMRRAQNDIRLWRGAQDQARLRSHISIGENPNGTPYRLRQLTRDLVDDLHIVRLAVDDAQKLSKRTLNPTNNIYVLSRLLRGAFGRAETFIRNGVVDFKTKAVTLGTSLEDALKPVAGRIDDFRDWIVAKRAKELHSQGRDTGLVQSDVDSVAAKYDSVPEFQDAFKKLKDWQKAVLQYVEDAGFITKEARAAMEKMNQDYVPMHRLFEIGAGELPSQESSGVGRGLNVGKPGSLKKLHGSVRPIVDPLEAIVKNVYALTVAAEKGFIHRKLAEMANMPGMGKWVEKIATPKVMEQVGLEKIRKQLEDAGADLSMVPDDLLLTFFKNSGRAPFGENIIRVVRDGKPEFYRLNSELFDTFHALDMEDAGMVLRLFSAPANLLRAGVTLTPDFALANAMRDAFTSAVVGKYTQFPFQAVIKGVAAMIGDPKLVAEFKAAGGKYAIEASYFDRTKLQKFIREKITKDLTPAEQAMVWVKSPLSALRYLTAVAEEATRIGEYKMAYEKLRASGLPEGDSRVMAAFEARDRQDFSKGGAKTKPLRMLAAFWNAGLQANVKLAQAFKERPVQTTLKGLAFITTAKLFEQALNWNDQDYWDRPQWERDLFFLIPISKDQNGRSRFLRIPTPFEVGLIFGTLPGRLLQVAKERDSRALDGFMNNVIQQTVPNPIPNVIMTIFENFLSGKQGWDVFRGKNIVPDALADLPPDMQFTEQTSLTAKKVGGLLGYSPLKIDHMISQLTGGLGKQIVYNAIDRAISLGTGEERTAKGVIPFGRFITTPAGMASQSIQEFYDNLSKIQGEEQRIKQTGNGAPWAQLGVQFRKAASAMSDLRKAARQTRSDKEKQAFYLQIMELARSMNKAARDEGVK